MDLNLEGKVALVCGASQGLGLGSAIELAKLGAEIILVARNATKLQANLEAINAINQKQNQFLALDFSDPENVRVSVEALIKHKNIHILINNTGGPAPGNLVDAEADLLVDAFSKHILISHLLTKILLPGMKQDDFGRIINIVSTSVRQPIMGLGVSNTTRGAMASWSKTMSQELAPYGVTVNNILPGTTKTERLDQLIDSKHRKTGKSKDIVTSSLLSEIPMARFAEVTEISSAIAFLASPAASYITGISLPVDGGKIKAI